MCNKYEGYIIRNVKYPVSLQNNREPRVRAWIEADYPRRWKLVKTNKSLGDPPARHSASAIVGWWIAIAQFHKRGDSSLRTKDVIISPLFSTASPLLSISDRRHPPRDVFPTLARNPLFARQTRIVCSQESVMVQVEGLILSLILSFGKGRNFNYGNIIRDRGYNCINWF